MKKDKDKGYFMLSLAAIVAICAITAMFLAFLENGKTSGYFDSQEVMLEGSQGELTRVESTFSAAQDISLNQPLQEEDNIMTGLAVQAIITCQDSDTGLNFEKKGITGLSSWKKEDGCDGKVLTEYYCGSVSPGQKFVLKTSKGDKVLRFVSFRERNKRLVITSTDGTPVTASVDNSLNVRLTLGREQFKFRILVLKAPLFGETKAILKTMGNTKIILFDEITCPVNCVNGACSNVLSEPVCGNGVIEEGETCDGNITSCYDKLGNSGVKECDEDCEWGDCVTQNICGDGIISTTENCEGDNLGGKSCQSFGYTGGTLSCNSYCKFITSGCIGTLPCNGPEQGLVSFSYSVTPAGTITDHLRKGETKTYTLEGRDYELTLVAMFKYFANQTISSMFSVNGAMSSELWPYQSENVSGGLLTVKYALLNPSSVSRVDFSLLDTFAGGTVSDYLNEGETKTYTISGKDYEVTSFFVNGFGEPSAILSVNGMLTRPMGKGKTQVMGGGLMVAIDSVRACSAEGISCTDSDGGMNYGLKGVTNGILGGSNCLSDLDACPGDFVNTSDVCNKYNVNNLDEYYCQDNKVMVVGKTCEIGCSDGACKANNTPDIADLAYYPSQFFENNAFTAKIVIGQNAPTSDIVAAIDILAGLQQAPPGGPFPVGIAVLDVDVKDPLNMDLISVGNPCNNKVSETLMGNPTNCREGLSLKQGLIKLFSNNGKTQILVSGYGNDEVLGTAYVMQGYKNYQLKGKQCIVTVHDLNTLEVSCESQPEVCADSDGGKNFYVKGSISGSMPPGYPSEDKCVVPEGRLREVLCENGYGTSYLYDCPYGCSNGACLESQKICTGTHDVLREGETKSYTIDEKGYELTAVFIDNPNQFAKFMVNNLTTSQLKTGGIYPVGPSADLNLEVRKIIASDREGFVEYCLTPVKAACTDTDGGKNFYVKGKISGSMPVGFISEDMCIVPEGRLREVLCDNNYGTAYLYDCPYGCSDGMCESQPAPRPDLTVSTFSHRNLPNIGTDPYAYFDITIRNIGEVAATLPVGMRTGIYRDSVSSANLIGMTYLGIARTLGRNESLIFSPVTTMQDANLKNITRLIVSVDTSNLVSESNEGNNALERVTVG